MKQLLLVFLLALGAGKILAQAQFDYRVELRPVQVSGLGGLHSYAFGQHGGRWLVIGGRLDGLHARQPFASFPANQNNTDILVIDPTSGQYWAAPVSSLPTSIAEQLQSTNMNFYQEADTLYITGGYAYSANAADHITFPYLTTINVSGLMSAVVNGDSINTYFKQLNNADFAVTGGQLGKMADTFYLVGGHRFDGRYNPMGNPTYTQTYSSQIRKFTVHNQGAQLTATIYPALTDQVHLHRRDYNLLPQVFPNGELGYTISSGVFQVGVDLPFLYPVDIRHSGITPQTTFNQYLSNYHSAKVCLYDSLNNQMHNLFFGGLSRYYYANGALVQDDAVPFVKTISRLSRLANDSLEEVALAQEMPALKGAGAEFIPNHALAHYSNEVIKMASFASDSIMLGHIYGGILSPSLNPFANNATNTTSADTSIYQVWLIRQPATSVHRVEGENPYDLQVTPNPIEGTEITVNYNLLRDQDLYYMLSDLSGRLIAQQSLSQNAGSQRLNIPLLENTPKGPLVLTFVFEGKFFVSRILHRQ